MSIISENTQGALGHNSNLIFFRIVRLLKNELILNIYIPKIQRVLSQALLFMQAANF